MIFANRYAFSAGSVRGSRLVLLLALAAGAVLGLAIPLWRLNRQRVIRRAESRFPQFEERLRTFTQREAQDLGSAAAPPAPLANSWRRTRCAWRAPRGPHRWCPPHCSRDS